MAEGPVPRPGILDIALYVGGEAHAPGAARTVRLASNEGAFGPSPAAVAAYRSVAETIHRYPDGGSADLRRAIAEVEGIDADRIVCGAGSDELIALIARSYAGPGDEVLYSEHGFLMYPIVARTVGAEPVPVAERALKADVDAILARVTDRTRIVFLANPNNPTGALLRAAEIARLHAGLPPRVVLAIDAAYAEYVDAADYTAGLDLADRAENVVVTRTFSKIHALGGLRLGWAYAGRGIADVLNRVRGPFNVSLPAQAAGAAAVRDRAFVEMSRAHNRRARAAFAERLAGLGLTVHPSAANFVLASFAAHPRADRRDAEAARQFLKARGVLVRQMGAYGLPDCLRITIGTDEEMALVGDLLAEHLSA
jgi:histidinol-phosphate aminotransferase